MEILSCDAGSCCYIVNFRRKVVEKGQSLHRHKVRRGTNFFCAPVKSENKCLQFSHPYHVSFRNLNKHPSRNVIAPRRYESINLRVLGETYSSYVLDGEEGVNNVTGCGKSVSKVLIPSLPNEYNGDSVAPISSPFWEWKPKLTIHYEKSGSENVHSPPLLFLPGFGVGSFHYEKQLKDLGCDFRAWAMDFLGQGMSLPCEDPTLRSSARDKLEADRGNVVWGFGDETETWAQELVYSVDLWRDQVRYFIEEKISDPRSIEQILEQVYADHSTNVDKVFSRILETTQHPAAAASFASILFAPQGQLSFKEGLSRCRMNNIPICLLYGKEDPWVKPIWGLWVKRQVPEALYYEISPAGHFPHDEIPEVVNFLLRGWIQNLESQGNVSLPLLDTPESADDDFVWNLEFIREGSKKSARVKFHMPKFSIWNLLKSQSKSGSRLERRGTD